MKRMQSVYFLFVITFNQVSQAIIQSDKPIDAQTLLETVGHYLSSNPIIIEAGAYNGHDTVQLAGLLPNGTVYAFEPVPELYRELCNSISGYNNIKPINKALSDKSGTALMHISHDPSKPESPSQSSSLLEPKDHLLYAPQVQFCTTTEVLTTTINDWAAEEGISSVDIFWFDMQGYELNALKESLNLLPTVKVIVTEVEFVEAYKGQYLFNDIKLWLEEQGFEMIEIHYQSWFGDAIFINYQAIEDELANKLRTALNEYVMFCKGNLTTEENDTHHLQDNDVDSQPVTE